MKTRLLLIAVLFVGCQEYGFEEVPSSTVNVKRFTQNISVSTDADILFVIDNSRSMVGEQTAIGTSFGLFAAELYKTFGDSYQIAVITTGIYSKNPTNQGCGDCEKMASDTICTAASDSSCINETGETGYFQSRKGRNICQVGDPFYPKYQFEDDPDCGKIIKSDKLKCFFEEAGGIKKGVVFTGVQGCGYERGLEAILKALSKPLINTENSGFLREDATLAVVVVSDEEDCGKVGDIVESGSGNVCYYASKGKSPDDKTVNPLTPVSVYYDFLTGLKSRKGLVKFAAIVGVQEGTDPKTNPGATVITYKSADPNAQPNTVCRTPGCTEPPNSTESCLAYPGTRYIQLADMFGLQEGGNGFVATICQNDFSTTLKELGTWVGCPRSFKLSEPILDEGLASILINDVPVATYTCNDDPKKPSKCNGTSDNTCPNSAKCLKTWTYFTPTQSPPAGRIDFASHYDPCKIFTSDFRLELVYATQ